MSGPSLAPTADSQVLERAGAEAGAAFHCSIVSRNWRRLRITVSLAGALLVGGTACAEQRPQPRSDSSAERSATQDPGALFRARLGRTWELARLGDREIVVTPEGSIVQRSGRYPGNGSRPTIRFTAEPATALSGGAGTLSAGGWSFCNGYGTAYELGPGNQLRFHQFQSTLVGCHGPDSLETRFFRALHLTRRFELASDSLSLIAADGGRLTFVISPDSTRSR